MSVRATDLADRLKTLDTSHPRIFLSDSGFQQMTTRVNADPVLSMLAAHVVEFADELCRQPLLEREMEGRRLLEVSRECLRRILYWGVAYHLTGQEAYAERAGREMRAVADFKDWNPSHFLDVGEMTAAMGLGYDWFYHALDAETRRTIREAILNKGLRASLSGNPWWVSHDNNWNQVCHGGLVIGALAIYEDAPEVAFKVIDRALKETDHGLRPYAPDGAYPEGPSYWAYGTTYSAMMLAALESVLGTDFDLSGADGFLESAGYFLHAAGPSGRFFNYSDSRQGSGVRPAAYWLANKLGQPSLLWRERQNLIQFNAGNIAINENVRMIPLVLVWAQGLSELSPPERLNWSGGGPTPVAFHRTSWTDPHASFVAIKGGSPSVNHAHMDIGQFVMESDGVRWAVDLGMQEYESLESVGLHIFGKDRWKVFRLANMSHNVLVVNGQPQGLQGSASIVRHEVEAEAAFTIIDMTPVYQGQLKQVRRGVALHSNGVVQIEDQIDALSQPTEIRWGMVTHAEVTINGPRRATLRQNGQSLSFEIVSAPETRLEIFEIEEPPNSYDARNPGAKMLGFKVSLNPGEADQRLSLALIPGSAERGDQALPAMSQW